jgi:hypothetical protein
VRVTTESLAAEVGLAQRVLLHHGSHGAVEHEDPVGQERLEARTY